MTRIEVLAQAGGLLACLTFIHFVSDWVFQSHAEAMVKHKDHEVRAKHCLVYSMFFVPWMVFFHFKWWQYLLGFDVLFYSHFLLDTYVVVYLWARYIRKPPEMNTDKDKGLMHDPKVGFKNFVSTSLGKILMITIDQLTHILMLWAIVILTMVRK